MYRLFFKAFSNTTRLRIVGLLRKKPFTVNELCNKTGFEQSRVSHNLRCLEHCGFVHMTRNGSFRTYHLDKETIAPILDLLEKHMKKYRKKLERCEVLRK
ncbi:winged helix-turn-helix transcriptional regulator [Candidatus Woesearchaeota archaeon]|nr:winged helix-turn-helix transcriptional regulator [Candidatus Woesearchaeota archaeon]